jgi:hypothetical protein
MRASCTLRRLAAGVALLLALSLIAACGGDDDDDNGEEATAPTATTVPTATTAPTETTAATASSGQSAASTVTRAPSAPTATTAAASTSTAAVATSEPTATEEPADESTEDPTAEPTEADEPTATSSGDSGSTDDICDVAATEPLDASVLPNFTLTMAVEATGDEGATDAFDINIQQSAAGTYHYILVAEDTEIEYWQIGDEAWFNQDGVITPIPAESGSAFSPDLFLTQFNESVPDLYDAYEAGTEEVSGRETTHYVITGEQFEEVFNQCAEAGETIADAEGSYEAWVDNELDVVIKTVSDLSWTDSNGVRQTAKIDMLVDDIGSTPEVTPPQ